MIRAGYNRLASIALSACLCALAWIPPAIAATVYDLKTDWSDAANPNGPWTYRQGSNALPHVADWQGLSGDFTGVQPAWARSETGTTNLPAWLRFVSQAGIPVDWQLGDIVTHSTDSFNGVGSGPSNVIWTSSLNGTIDISGGVWMGRDIGRGNHWDISLNGASLSGGDIFSGDSFDRTNPFLFTSGSGGSSVLTHVPVVIGDVVQLQITKTSAPGDYAGVNLTITASLSGDYNADNRVDAADYVLWRMNPSAFGGDPTGYNTWRSHFGESASGRYSIKATVPEPSTLVLLGIGAINLLRHRKAKSPR